MELSCHSACLSKSSGVGCSLALFNMVPFLSEVMVEARRGRSWEKMWLLSGPVTGDVEEYAERVSRHLVSLRGLAVGLF